MPMNELERFVASWDREAANTTKVLAALPTAQYDFRPDGGGQSLGELAWHLAEGDAYISTASSAESSQGVRSRRTSSAHALSRRWRRDSSAFIARRSLDFARSRLGIWIARFSSSPDR